MFALTQPENNELILEHDNKSERFVESFPDHSKQDLIRLPFRLMKKIKRPFAVFLGVLFCISCLAQETSFPGFYVTLQGDTVRGVFTHYTGFKTNPALVEFSPANGSPVVLTTANCQSFRIEGYDEYVAYAGNRLLNPIENSVVAASKNILDTSSQLSPVRIFLREIKKSPQVALYELKDETRTNFFYKLPGQAPVELVYKKTFSQDRVVEAATYRQQIKDLFQGEINRLGLSTRLEKLPYEEKNLVNFFNDLFPTQQKVVHKSRTPNSGWVASAGISYNFLKVSGEKSVDAVGKSYDASLSPLLSVGYLQPIGGNFGKYFLYPHLNLYRYKNTSESTDQRFRKIITFQSDVAASAALNVGVHLVNEGSLRFFVSAGAGFMVLVNNKQIDDWYLLTDNSEFSFEERKHTGVSFTANVTPGLIIKDKVVLLATYSVPTPVGYYSFYKPWHSNVQVTLGYKWN